MLQRYRPRRRWSGPLYALAVVLILADAARPDLSWWPLIAAVVVAVLAIRQDLRERGGVL